jgi:hypothetical protein
MLAQAATPRLRRREIEMTDTKTTTLELHFESDEAAQKFCEVGNIELSYLYGSALTIDASNIGAVCDTYRSYLTCTENVKDIVSAVFNRCEYVALELGEVETLRAAIESKASEDDAEAYQ